jgi:ABC-type lipoprotein export system ATPase subunit
VKDKGLTIVPVTHERDIAQFAKRVLVFRDGKFGKKIRWRAGRGLAKS